MIRNRTCGEIRVPKSHLVYLYISASELTCLLVVEKLKINIIHIW